MRCLRPLLLICSTVFFTACGGGGGGGGGHSVTVTPAPSGANVQAISVNGGPGGNVNLPLVSVQVCETSSSARCVTINNILVDTGSSGLRVLSSALSSVSLTAQTVGNNPLLECVKFVDDSHAWGAIKIADVKIGGKTASSIRIQAIGNPQGIVEPSVCGVATDNLDTLDKLGANGILGVGQFTEDCGSTCANVTNNKQYFSCTGSSCVSTSALTIAQVQNPVAAFDSDNNGVIIQLPSIAATGAANIDGWLIFGIGTQSNNTLGSEKIFTLDNSGYISTTYKGDSYPHSFLDSGSNGFYFPDSSIPKCMTATDFYCPTSTLNLSATIIGENNASTTVNFSVANAESFASTVAAVPTLAGPYDDGFDWGLPFFIGRKVYTAFENNSSGTYVAF
ncbi:MAG: Heavy-chain fibroin-like protein [Verrucomicrobiaceae bacterium]|nr:Heavy-chain fibroin-like protein [Verrucomicrobiaceae bacterium]